MGGVGWGGGLCLVGCGGLCGPALGWVGLGWCWCRERARWLVCVVGGALWGWLLGWLEGLFDPWVPSVD